MRLSLSLSGLALVTLMAGPFTPAFAQNAQPALAGANAHAREMLRLFPDGNQSSQATPRLIPKLEIDQDPSGGGRDRAAERADDNVRQRIFSGSRHQWPDLLYLPSAADRMDDQCRKRAGTLSFCEHRLRSDLPAGRWCDLPDR